MSDTEVVPFAQRIGALTAGDVRSQVNLIQEIMSGVMKVNDHYGVIPGTGTKPTLLKAGAEKLCLTFRLDPQYEITERRDGAHLTVMSKCTLYHIPTSQRVGSGMGSCSTMESKYAYRVASRQCPACGAAAIIKGKDEYGGGWVCFKKKGGCGAKYGDGSAQIESQPQGRVPNEDLPDQYNTVLKMANKRSLVAAVLNATAASDIFTQDIEDMPQFVAAEPVTEAAPVARGEVIDHETGEVTPAPKTAAPKTEAKSVSGQAWEGLDEEQQKECRTLVDCIRGEYNQNGAESAAKLWSEETEGWPVELTLGAWSLFPKDERSAIKSAQRKGAK